MSTINDHNLGDVWHRSGGAYGAMDRAVQQLAWLTPEQRCRTERLRQASLLFGGAHRQLYVVEGRSQFRYPKLSVDGTAFFTPLNVLGLMSVKLADLLFGESPKIKIDDEDTQTILDGLVERSWLTPSLHAAAVEQSWAGETYLEVTFDEEAAQAFVGHVPAKEIYPVGTAGVDRQHASYVRYATQRVKGVAANEQIDLLLETTYSAGKITRELYRLDQTGPAGATRGEKLNLELWPARRPDGSPLPEVETTGLDRPSLIRVPNDANGTSDYDGLLEEQDAINGSRTQINRVLAQHADPKLLMPEENFDANGNFPADANVIAKRAGGEKPEYLTWEAELDAAMKNFDTALATFAMSAETPLSFLGLKSDATAESATKMRLNASAALLKAARKAGYWQPAIRLALALAVEVQTGAQPTKPIGIALKDGLPSDPLAIAEEIATKRGAGVMSKRRALEAEGLERGAIQDELKELEEETKQSMPNTLFGEGPAAATAASTGDGEEIAARIEEDRNAA